MYSDSNKILKQLNHINLDDLPVNELRELRELIKHLLSNSSFTVVNTLKKDKDIPSMCVMLHPLLESNKGNVNTEIICKVAYIPEIITRYMQFEESNIKELFLYLGEDIKTVVRCYCRYLQETTFEFGENNSRIKFIFIGLDNIHNILLSDNIELSNTLFIFSGITFEALSFLLLSKGITLHGGTHTRRHLLTTLDLTLALCIRDIFEYLNESMVKDLIDVKPADQSDDETSLIRESKSTLLKWRVSDSYYNTGGHKMCFNDEYMDLRDKFSKILKLVYKVKYTRNLIQILFLRFYSVQLTGRIIKMVLNEEGNTLFKNIFPEGDVTSMISKKNIVKPTSVSPTHVFTL